MPTVEEIFRQIDAALRQGAPSAQGTQVVYQFDISGEEAGTYQIVMRENEAFAHSGEQETPDCTISVDSENFKKLVEGKLSPTLALMGGRLKIKGDMNLAMRLKDVLAAYRSAGP